MRSASGWIRLNRRTIPSSATRRSRSQAQCQSLEDERREGRGKDEAGTSSDDLCDQVHPLAGVSSSKFIKLRVLRGGRHANESIV